MVPKLLRIGSTLSSLRFITCSNTRFSFARVRPSNRLSKSTGGSYLATSGGMVGDLYRRRSAPSSRLASSSAISR